MNFVSTKIDYAFKKIFGSEENKEILISFLNAIIYDGEKTIESVTIINPFTPDRVISLKDLQDTCLDIKAVLFDGSLVFIEMEIAGMTKFSKAVMYNLVKGYNNQLKIKDDFLLLHPTIVVTIMDFIFFRNKADVINPFVFKHQEQNWEYPDEELKLIFVELPKFNKTLSELETLADKWIYFLKEAGRLDDIPESLGMVAEIEKAFNFANKINMTSEELERVEYRAIGLQDQKGRIAYAEQQGIIKGEAKARLSKAIAFVMGFLKKRFPDISTATTSQVENLLIEDMESLEENLLDFNSLEDLESWLNSYYDKSS